MLRSVKLALLAAALLAVPALGADKEKLAIVDLDVPPGMLGLSIQVTKAVLTEAQRQKRAVITPDELREKLGNKSLNELIKCADSPACVQDKLGALGVTRAVTGKLNRDEKNYVLQLYLVDLKTMSVVTDVDRSILIASRRFQKDVEAAVPGFLRGEREAHGTLIVNATVQNTQISLNGEFMGVAPITTTLKPGKYELKAEKKSYLPVKRFVDVEPNRKTVEEVRMLLIPGQKPEEEIVPAPIAQSGQGGTAPNAAGGGGGFRLTAPTLVVGLATLASFGVGLIFGLITNGIQSNLRQGYNPATDIYAGTREQALTAKTDAYVANTGFIIAGVGLIATVILTVLDALRPVDGEVSVDVTPPPAAAPAPAPAGAPP
jgi:hypothetical protein